MRSRGWVRAGVVWVLLGGVNGCHGAAPGNSPATQPRVAGTQPTAQTQGAAAQNPGTQNTGTQNAGTQDTGTQRATSTPYAGDLSIFEDPQRDKRMQTGRILDLMHITAGTSVADIGAGSGWFTVRAARRAGKDGAVYAEDINPAAIKYIDDRAARENLSNIHTLLGTPDESKLPPTSVDAVMLLKVYHEIARPVPFMRQLRQALKPGARVGIIDRNGDGSGTDHGLPEATLLKEMDEAGYKRTGRYDFTKKDGQDYFLIFEAK